MSIIYNGQTVAGVYAEQILNNADTINAGIIKIATQEEVDTGENNTSAVTPLYLSSKQNKLESGDNISIENDIISCDIKPDVSTIIQNEDGTLTNVGQLTKSGTIKIDWEGTEAEYTRAMLNGEIDPNWYCYITDDESLVDYADVANQSLSNLRPEGEARFDTKLDKNQITNCLLEVPQKIKLELTDGTLTLKAGSKVIVPNGVGVFVEKTLTSDRVVSLNVTSGTNKTLVYIRENLGDCGTITLGNVSSGESHTARTWSIWYDTKNNIVNKYNDDANTVGYTCALPLAEVTLQDGVCLSIDQVFNGFGYIGSTIWVDKGVKGLIPNGRNEDGSLNNVEFVSSKVITHSKTDGNSRNGFDIVIDKDGVVTFTNAHYEVKEDGYIYNMAGTAKLSMFAFGTYSSNADTITSFQPKLPFRAVDYNDLTNELNTKADKLDTYTKTEANNTFVKLTGGTINGDVTLKKPTGYTSFNLRSANSVSSTVPSAWTGLGGIYMYDGVSQQTGYIQNAQPTNNTNIVSTSVGAKRNISGTTKTAQIVVSVDSSGNAFFDFPMCTTKATTTSSAKTNKVAVVVQNYVNGTSWYRVWSDGWKEQGGQCTAVESDARYMNITYLKAFSNTNYTLTLAGVSQSMSNTDYAHIYSITASGARLVTAGGAKPIHWYACGY